MQNYRLEKEVKETEMNGRSLLRRRGSAVDCSESKKKKKKKNVIILRTSFSSTLHYKPEFTA